MGLKLANNALSRLSASISPTDTTVTLVPGGGAAFPALATGDYFPATIVKADGSLEIVKVTARSADVLTVVRAQETTTAKAFNAGDRIELRLTAGTYASQFTDVDSRLSTQNNLHPSGVALTPIAQWSTVPEMVTDNAALADELNAQAQALLNRTAASVRWANTIIGFDASGLSDGAMVFFKGRDTVGDGGGGPFRYSASSTQAVDGGLVFEPVGGGRIFRDRWTVFGFSGTVLAAWFGVKGDGTDETTKVQAAVNALRPGDTLSGSGRTYTVKKVKLKSQMTLRDANFLTLAGAVPSEYWSPVTIGDNGDTTTYTDITCINVHVNGNRVNNITGGVGFPEDGGKHGFRIIGNVKRVKFIECSAQYCGSYGFFFYRGLNTATIPFNDVATIDDVQLINCVGRYNKAHGGAADSVSNFHIIGGSYNFNGLTYQTDPGGFTLSGAAYGNGWDFEGYGIGSYINKVRIRDADLRFNAAASLLFVDTVDRVAEVSRFAFRNDILIHDVQADTGTDPTRTNPYAAIIMVAPYENWAKGIIYKDVNIIGGVINGEINIACVGDIRIDVNQNTPRTKLGDAAYCERVVVNTASQYRFNDLSGADISYLYAQPENFLVTTNAAGLEIFSSKEKFGLDIQMCYSDTVSFAAGEEKVMTANLPRNFDNAQIGAFGFVDFVSASGEVYAPRSDSGTSGTVQCLVKNGSTAQNIRIGFVVFGR